ncbi:MAG TPA: hypothetical protein VKC56_05505 [Gallionellaceae bacterium]|nr:hypothetical protein [Gallionellaceae bacterium]
MKTRKILPLLLLALLAGCAAPPESHILEGEEQVKLRAMETRAFDTSDKNAVLRAVISTLQDLSFVIDKADADLGTVTATKLSGYRIRMTVTVRPGAGKQLLVRASAQYNLKPIEDPEVYQRFFAALSKALFLQANAVE